MPLVFGGIKNVVLCTMQGHLRFLERRKRLVNSGDKIILSRCTAAETFSQKNKTVQTVLVLT